MAGLLAMVPAPEMLAYVQGALDDRTSLHSPGILSGSSRRRCKDVVVISEAGMGRAAAAVALLLDGLSTNRSSSAEEDVGTAPPPWLQDMNDRAAVAGGGRCRLGRALHARFTYYGLGGLGEVRQGS